VSQTNTAQTAPATAARRVIEACAAIARCSESADAITRTYLASPVRDVHRFLRSWMDRLGMESWVDAAGNLRGLRRCGVPNAPRLVLGSHIDTVPNSGAYDGVLGVAIALGLIEALETDRLGYDIEVVAFSEEEGVRFAAPFLGSRALVGTLDEQLLNRVDAKGISVAQAITDFGLDPADIPAATLHPDSFAYVEFHIEQGPVLEDLDLSLGVVEAIVGQSRHELAFRGKANHAGTTPMHLRHDALAGAAEWIQAVERKASATAGLVATVGRIHASPGAANVIPGEVRASLDVRHADDAVRLDALAGLLETATRTAASRGLGLETRQQLDEPATPMSPALANALEAAALAAGHRPHRMVSGAGHDALVLAKKLPTAMLFLRSPGGVSHHPDEAVRAEDVRAALDAGLYFLRRLDPASVRDRRG
jgi:allantoate deiminase